MQKIANGLVATLLVAVMGFLAVPVSEAALPVEERLARLEQHLKHQAFQMDLSTRLEALQAEVQALRGKIEEQQHLLGRLRTLELPEKEKNLVLTGAPEAASFNKSSKALYDAAFEYVRRHEHKQAQQALKRFLSEYPDAKEAPDAHYWLGEVYLLDWQVDPTNYEFKSLAEKEFKHITLYFSDHQRAPQAMLKLGLLAEMNHDWEHVKFYLHNLVDQYPMASSTRIAKARLERLTQEGHI